MSTPQAVLPAILVRRGVLTTETVAALEARSPHIPVRRWGAVLVEEGLVSEADVAQALAEQQGVPYRALEQYRVDFDAFPAIPVEWMRQHGFVPLEGRDGVLTIASADPTDLTTLVLVQENEQGEEVLSHEKISQDHSPIVRLVDTLVMNALQKRASDIHIEPADGVTEVKYRIDGVLYLAMEPLDIRFHNPLVSRIKVMSKLDIAERRVPQDRRFKLRIEQRRSTFACPLFRAHTASRSSSAFWRRKSSPRARKACISTRWD